MKRPSMALLSLVIAMGCTEQPTATKATPVDQLSQQVVAAPSDSNYVATPAGLYHKSCVHEVLSGEQVNTVTLAVSRANRTTRQFTPCAFPRPSQTTITGGRPIVQASSAGWSEWAEYYSTPNLRTMSAKWVVPSFPVSTYSSSGKVLYEFAGFLDNNPTILQPVLQFGNNGSTGGAYWQVESWSCGGSCFHSTPFGVNPLDTIVGTIHGDWCSLGSCIWRISTVRPSTGDSTVTVASGGADDFHQAIGGVIEQHGLTTCSQVPGGGVKFFALAFTNTSGSFTPTFGQHYDSTATPICGWGVIRTSTTVALTDSVSGVLPTLNVEVSGPTYVLYGGGSGTWTAIEKPAYPGTPPYTYSWTGILSGTGASISGAPSTSGWLYLQVTDAAGNSAANSLYVTICAYNQFTC